MITIHMCLVIFNYFIHTLQIKLFWWDVSELYGTTHVCVKSEHFFLNFIIEIYYFGKCLFGNNDPKTLPFCILKQKISGTQQSLSNFT